MIFSDGSSFGSSVKYPFKTVVSHKNYNSNLWDIVDVNIPQSKEALIKDFCWAQIDKSYDWCAIFFSIVLPLRKEDSRKWICSEVCVSAFQKAGYFTDVRACRVTPGKFGEMVQKI
jgi:hypothetical protein